MGWLGGELWLDYGWIEGELWVDCGLIVGDLWVYCGRIMDCNLLKFMDELLANYGRQSVTNRRPIRTAIRISAENYI